MRYFASNGEYIAADEALYSAMREFCDSFGGRWTAKSKLAPLKWQSNGDGGIIALICPINYKQDPLENFLSVRANAEQAA